MASKLQTEVVPGVGDRIAAIIRRHETIRTGVALARAAKLSRQTLHRALKEDTLTRQTARAVADALSVSVETLVPDEDASDTHVTSAAVRERIPPKAYAFVYRKLEDLKKAGLSSEQLTMAETLFYSDSYARLNKQQNAPMTEDDWNKKVRADWAGIADYLRSLGVLP